MLNVATIMGRFVRDPELRKTGSGKSVASFSLAVDRDRKNESGDRDVDFIDCVAWGQTCDFVSKYFQKGSMAVVSGRLQVRSWTDKDGNKRRASEIVVGNIYFAQSRLDGRQEQDCSPSQTVPNLPDDFAQLDGEDLSLPF